MSMFSKPKTPSTPWSLGPMNMNLPAAQGVQVSQLPGIPQIQMPQAAQMPAASQGQQSMNPQNLMQLLTQFQAR